MASRYRRRRLKLKRHDRRPTTPAWRKGEPKTRRKDVQSRADMMRLWPTNVYLWTPQQMERWRVAT